MLASNAYYRKDLAVIYGAGKGNKFWPYALSLSSFGHQLAFSKMGKMMSTF